jgi:hypothetical protein
MLRMTYLGAGVVLLIAGVLLAVFVQWTLGIIVAVIGGALILYSVLAGRGRRRRL